MSRSSLFVIALASLFAFDIVRQAMSKRTAERHTFSWLLICVVVIGLAIWRDALDELATALGVHYAPSAFFFAACAGLLWLVYRQSLQLAEIRRQVSRLAQEVALQSLTEPRRDGAQPEPDGAELHSKLQPRHGDL